MKEVLVNLLENARAAIPEEGWVRVEVQRQGGQVVLGVRDNGTGIPAELQPRISRPALRGPVSDLPSCVGWWSPGTGR